MTTVEVNYFVRLLSSVYVYFWIPIRLSYLRLKFKLRPALKASGEVFAIAALLLMGVPLSIVYMLAKGLKHLIKLLVITLCNLIETTTGIDRVALYDSVLSDDCLLDEPTEISEGNNDEQPIDDAVNESIESDDKNEQESTE